MQAASGNLYGVTLDLQVIDRITLIEGDSGIGKSLIFSYLDNLSKYQEREKYLCINSIYAQKIRRKNESEERAILNVIKTSLNKWIVIDNADVILSKKLRDYIVMDTNNNYILFGRNVEGLWANEDNLAKLVFDESNRSFSLAYPFKRGK